MDAPNNWDIKRCLTICLVWYVIALVLIELTNLGLDVPVLRQLVILLFLALVPGILILRILKIHNISIIESLLYSVGLSIACIMVVGVILNFALPALNVSHPISIFPLLIALTIAILILGIAAYIRDKSFVRPRPPSHQIVKEVKTNVRTGSHINIFLLAVLLPLLAILGVSLVNSYQNKILLLALVFVIAIIIGFIAFNKLIPESAYPFVLFMISLALLYQTTLLSPYLVGSDIHTEYYYAKLVSENGYWNASIANAINSCLSIVMLAPIYSTLLHIDIVLLFKIIYPLVFCLVPLALFCIFRIQMTTRYAFLAAFFFISLPMFFMDMTQLARQQISELFFVLVILLLVERKLNMIQRMALVLIFGFGVIVSYYGLGTGFVIGYLALGLIISIVIKSQPVRAMWQWIIGRSNSLPDDLSFAGAFNKKTIAVVVGLSLVFMFTYYGVVASGTGSSGIRVIAGITQSVIKSGGSFTDLSAKEPLVQTALGLDLVGASALGKIWRILQYLVEFCFFVGFLRLVFRPATLGKLKAEYISLVIVSTLILIAIFILPYWSQAIGVTRVWQITLLIMSPLFIFGGEAIALGAVKTSVALRKGFTAVRTRFNYQALTWIPVIIIMLPYFVFNSGAVFEISRNQTSSYIDIPYSITLSGYRLDLNTIFTQQDVAAASWLCRVLKEEEAIFVDINSSRLFVNRIDYPCEVVGISYEPPKINADYVYLRGWNVQNNKLTFATGYATRKSVSFDDLPWLRKRLETGDIIYNNSAAQILMLGDGYP